MGLEQEKIKAEHRQAGENVGQQNADDPRQRGDDRQRDDQADECERRQVDVMGAQQQPQDPQCRQCLRDHDRPEVERPSGGEEQPVDDRTAGNQITLEPAGEIAARVPLQQRKAIPDRRCQQHDRCRQHRQRAHHNQHAPAQPRLCF